MFLLDPPKQVQGHPIAILEIMPGSGSFPWQARLRITAADKVAETCVLYAVDRRIIIRRLPGCPEVFRILVAARGTDPDYRHNPLADAIEDVVRQVKPAGE